MSIIDPIMVNAIRYRLTLPGVSDAVRRADIEWLLSRLGAARKNTLHEVEDLIDKHVRRWEDPSARRCVDLDDLTEELGKLMSR